MNMPRFTAEASFYQTNNHYRLAAGNFLSNGDAAITPQGCGLFELATCGFSIAICIPLVAEACASDLGSCTAAWALCMGGSYGVCEDCIDNIIKGGEGGGGGGVGGTSHPCCPPGTRCCGGCTKVPGQGLFCEGDCVGRGRRVLARIKTPRHCRAMSERSPDATEWNPGIQGHNPPAFRKVPCGLLATIPIAIPIIRRSFCMLRCDRGVPVPGHQDDALL